MSGNIRVFMEDGKRGATGQSGDDGIFLKKYIEVKYGKTALIQPMGGYTNLDLVKNEFEKNTDQGGTNLVVFDADTPAQDMGSGGYDRRKAYLEHKRSELGVQFDLFLFPNNQADGQFETLLAAIINPDNAWLLSCFDAYAQCLETNGAVKLPSIKDKLYAYCDALLSSREEKEQFKRKKGRHYADPRLFDLDHSYLAPLKDFLHPYFA